MENSSGDIHAEKVILGATTINIPKPRLVLNNFLGSGKNLCLKLEDDTPEGLAKEIRPFFEELFSIPGVKEVFEKHGAEFN